MDNTPTLTQSWHVRYRKAIYYVIGTGLAFLIIGAILTGLGYEEAGFIFYVWPGLIGAVISLVILGACWYFISFKPAVMLSQKGRPTMAFIAFLLGLFGFFSPLAWLMALLGTDKRAKAIYDREVALTHHNQQLLQYNALQQIAAQQQEQLRLVVEQSEASRRKVTEIPEEAAHTPDQVAMHAASSGDRGSQLASVAELHAAGVLSDEEYVAAKARIIG